LKARIEGTERSQSILRSATSFMEVLERQDKLDLDVPTQDEANHVFVVKDQDEITDVIQEIKAIMRLTN